MTCGFRVSATRYRPIVTLPAEVLGKLFNVEEERLTAADLLMQWREATRAAELAERLAEVATRAADRSDASALASEQVAGMAEKAAVAAERAARTARSAASRPYHRPHDRREPDPIGARGGNEPLRGEPGRRAIAR